jgi:hypothetical protein
MNDGAGRQIERRCQILDGHPVAAGKQPDDAQARSVGEGFMNVGISSSSIMAVRRRIAAI